jgi:DNA repair protein RadD
LRVDYRLGLDHWQSEWICVEHDGYARQKAAKWWRLRSHDPVPDEAERAVELAEAGALCQTEEIVVRSEAGEKYDGIVSYKLGPTPEAILAGDTLVEEEVPF